MSVPDRLIEAVLTLADVAGQYRTHGGTQARNAVDPAIREALDALAQARAERDRASTLEDALRGLVSEIEDTVDCSCEDGETWRCTVQYDDGMLTRAKRALHGFSERRMR